MTSRSTLTPQHRAGVILAYYHEVAGWEVGDGTHDASDDLLYHVLVDLRLWALAKRSGLFDETLAEATLFITDHHTTEA